MREREIERKLVNAVKERGGICWKFTSPGTAGVPDRIILMPEGRIAFVEVKAPGEKPRPLQLSRHRLLRKLGFKVYVLDNIDDITKILSEVMNYEAT
ncbi:VRR-NUC domain-containing protein [Ruminococcus sp.]|uniref:VRR-NUC domain-containing protein n=1 Tax=Ruminococcus sp. TaxID=41978 RepID=UPI0025D11234|nr:VRR-NUC domain-containing protein [Ruminococcus sp.]